MRDSRYRDSRYTLSANSNYLIVTPSKRINISYAFTVFSNDFKADNVSINQLCSMEKKKKFPIRTV